MLFALADWLVWRWLAKYHSPPSSRRKTKWLPVSNKVNRRQVRLLFGLLVIQLVWYILKQLFTSAKNSHLHRMYNNNNNNNNKKNYHSRLPRGGVKTKSSQRGTVWLYTLTRQGRLTQRIKKKEVEVGLTIIFQQIIDVIELYLTKATNFVVILMSNYFATFKMPVVNL